MWRVCDDFCFKAKNLYNSVLFILTHAARWKQLKDENAKERISEYVDIVKDNGKIEKYKLINRLVYLNHPDYRALPAQTSQQVVFEVCDLMKGTYAQMTCGKVKGDINLPSYKHKSRGRFVCTFTKGNSRAINGVIYYKRMKEKLGFFGIETKHPDYQTVDIIPNIDGTFHLSVNYRVDDVSPKTSGNIFSIDLGIDNLMTITSDKVDCQPVLINGRPLKSMNHYWNKKKAKMQSMLPHEEKQRKTSKAIRNLVTKRNCKINDFLHKSSRKLINLAIENNVYRIIVGHNKDWQRGVNIGKANNQTFSEIPYSQLIAMIRYKAEDAGIDVIEVNESYTSKCSALDKEKICKHETYLGKRTKRGLFKTSTGIEINADVNGSLNILRKVIGDGFIDLLNIGCVLQPRRLTI